MSRCFAYPPPGYTPSRAGEEALIESIKLQKEREKTKDKELRKKEKKREKEEKRKEKKDKARLNLEKSNIVQGDFGEKILSDAKAKEKELRKKEKKRLKEEKKKQKKEKKHQNLEKPNIVQRHNGEKLCVDARGELRHKPTVAEHLEQVSNLTEEHGKPVSVCEPSTSSDSTENSNKRKRECLPVDVSREHGKTFRIRLSSKKLSEPDVSAKEQPCSSGRTYSLSQDNDIGIRHKQANFCSTLERPSDKQCITEKQHQISSTSLRIDTVVPRGTTVPSKTKAPMSSVQRAELQQKQMSSTSLLIDTVVPRGTRIPSKTNAPMSSVQRVEMQYESLTSNWALPALHDAPLDPDNLDWLFKGNKSGNAQSEKKRQICRSEDIFSSSSLMLWPRAQYIQEVDVYAMPFTVPF